MSTPNRTWRLVAIAAAVLAVSSGAVAESYEFRRPTKGLTVRPAAPPAPGSQTPTPAPTPAPAPAPTFSAETSTRALIFDPIDIGTSAKRSVLLLNTGTGALSVSTPTTTGASFSGATQCGATLAPGESCAVEVTFSPVAGGPQTGELVIPASVTDGSPFAVSLSGIGLFSAGSLIGDNTSFGDVPVGDSASLAFIYRNTGNKVLSGVNSSFTGSGVSLSNNTCGTAASPVALAPDATCGFTALFMPTVVGALTNGSVSVAANGVATQTKNLSGRGLGTVATLTEPADGAFGDVPVGTSKTLTFTYSNTGTSTLTGVKATLTGATTLVLGANTCGTTASPVSLAAGESCTVKVTYTPTSTTSLSDTSALSVASTDFATQTKPLTGRGFGANGLLGFLDSFGFEFGEVVVNTSVSRTVRWRNTGNATATGVYVSLTGSNRLSLTNNSCGTQAAPVSITPLTDCFFTIVYAPTTAGEGPNGNMSNASVSVVSSAFNSPQFRELSGTAVVNFSSLMTGYTADAFSFPRSTAWTSAMGPTWYWNVANASTNNVAGTTVEFRRTITVTGTVPVTAHLYGAVDNRLASIDVNGTRVQTGPAWGLDAAYTSTSFTLQPGTNVIAVRLTNEGTGPAGFAIQTRNSSNSVLADVAGWKYAP